MIRVLLVDDQTLVRQGVRSLLELAADLEVVAEAEDGEAALRLIPEHAPDVVLLDMRMPRLSGLEVLERLHASGQLPPTLILTTFDDDALVLDGIRAGAKGYLLKDVSLEVLLSAIRTLAAGGSLIQPAVTERILRGFAREAAPAYPQLEPLTERETEILRLMSGGYSNKEIARALKLTEGTVKNHVSSILGKMGVRDRTRAVLKALDTGLL